MYLQINFGRNLANDEPMPAVLWDEFRFRLGKVTTEFVEDIAWETDGRPELEYAEGTGTWNGITEVSGKLSIYFDQLTGADILRDYPITVAEYRDALARIAGDFGQDAVAMILTDSVLIPSVEY